MKIQKKSLLPHSHGMVTFRPFFHSFTFLAHTLIKQQDMKRSERQLSMEVHLVKKTLAKLAAYCTIFQKRFQDLWCTLGQGYHFPKI